MYLLHTNKQYCYFMSLILLPYIWKKYTVLCYAAYSLNQSRTYYKIVCWCCCCHTILSYLITTGTPNSHKRRMWLGRWSSSIVIDLDRWKIPENSHVFVNCMVDLVKWKFQLKQSNDFTTSNFNWSNTCFTKGRIIYSFHFPFPSQTVDVTETL